MSIFSRNVKALRKAKGLRQVQITSRAGWKRQARLSELEHGLEPTTQEIADLAFVLGVDPDILTKKHLSLVINTAGDLRILVDEREVLHV